MQIISDIDLVKEEIESYARTYTNSVRDEVKSYTNSKIDAAKVEIKSDTDNAIVATKDEVKSYANSEDEKLESRLHDWHRTHMNTHDAWPRVTPTPTTTTTHPDITLEGHNAGPNRGTVYYQGRPLCDDDSHNKMAWDINEATVICKMLGFSRATAAPHYTQEACFGSCPPKGMSFAMSGFKCNGSETNIDDCPHDATVSRFCGTNNVTRGDFQDIVGVECA